MEQLDALSSTMRFATDGSQYLTFPLGGEEYGVEILKVQEIRGYSPITSTMASWLTAIYDYDPISKTMKTPGPMEADSPSGDSFEMMGKWFANLMKDTFG